MDSTLESIVSFVSEVNSSAIRPAALELTKRHLADAIACGAGAFSADTPGTVRKSIAGITATPGASAYGIKLKTAPELAAFANASTNRYLDLNDYGPSGHPSDMMPSQLATAEANGASGADMLRGIYIAYEVATAIADALPPTEMPWDVGLYYSVGAAAGMASILALSADETASAISLALVPNIPLRVTRRSPVSQWRSSATAHTCMSAAFACRLAQAGMTGPPEPFQGSNGLFEVAIRPISLDLGRSDRSAIERGSLKKYQVCFLAQSAVDAAMRVRRRINADEIERVIVHTTRDTWSYVGGGHGDQLEKWNPQTRETADHSIPYILAAVFRDGRVDFDSFSGETIRKREWETMINRVEVVPDEQLTNGPTASANPSRLTVELRDGTAISELSTFPYDATGVGPEDAEEKFLDLTRRVLPEPRVRDLHALLLELEAVKDLEPLGQLLRAFGSVAR